MQLLGSALRPMGPSSSQAIAEVLRQSAHALVHLGVAFWRRGGDKQESTLGCSPAQCLCDYKVSLPDEFSLADECERTLAPIVRGYLMLTSWSASCWAPCSS